MPEIPLETTEHLVRDAYTLAGEKELADLEAWMSANSNYTGAVKTKLDTLRDGTIVLTRLLIATVRVSDNRTLAIRKLREFFTAAASASTET